MVRKVKTAFWTCNRCGNTKVEELNGEELKQPAFCECKNRDWKLDLKRTEFLEEPVLPATGKIGHEENVFSGKKEYEEHNINQGVFKEHFYFGKIVYMEDQLVESVVFDDGSTATNWEDYLVEQMVIDGNGKNKIKLLPYGSNQIKALGFNYHNKIIPQKNSWSNVSIDFFIKNKSVGGEGGVCANLSDIGGGVIHHTEGSYGNNNKNRFTAVLTIGSYYIPTPYTQLHKGKALFQTIISVFDQYMDVPDRRSLMLAASFVVGSYCFSLFDAVGYIFFNSDKESGKTKFATLISLMGFHSVNCSSPSESALFRITSLTMGLMVIDDFENISEEKKNALLQILKVGYRKEGRIIRVEKKKDMFVPKMFDCFCPKIVTNTTTLDAITLSRCIPIHLMKTLTDKGKLYPREKDSGWQAVRDACHLFVMENWKEIEKVYEEYQCDALNNRDLELVKGFLSIVKVVDVAWHDQLLEYLVDCFKDRETVDMSGSWAYALFALLLELGTEEGCWLKTKSIADDLRSKVVSEASCEDEKEFKQKKGGKLPTPRFVGSSLSKISYFKKRRVGAGVEYFVSKKLVEDYMKVKGFYVEKEKGEPEQKTLKQ